MNHSKDFQFSYEWICMLKKMREKCFHFIFLQSISWLKQIFSYRPDELTRRCWNPSREMSEFSPTKVLNAARSSKHDFALGKFIQIYFKIQWNDQIIFIHFLTGGRKSKTIQDESEDPSHLLNVWLGELDSLQKVQHQHKIILKWKIIHFY